MNAEDRYYNKLVRKQKEKIKAKNRKNQKN